MHDGHTRKVETEMGGRSLPYLVRNRVSLTLMSGPEAGREWPLEGTRTIAGRSGKAGIQLEDSSVSTEHAVFEVSDDGPGVRDLASTNGVEVNGQSVLSRALVHGDRIRLGDCELQIVVEAQDSSPRVWSIEEDV